MRMRSVYATDAKVRITMASALLLFMLLFISSLISGQAFAQADESGSPSSTQIGSIDLAAPTLEPWHECATPDVRDHARSLCATSDGGIEFGAYEILLGMIRAGTANRGALCIIDESLVLSEADCLKPDPGGFAYRRNGLQFGNLMEAVAENWHRLGTPYRADQLYARMHAIFDRDFFLRSVSISVMRDWAVMKADQGRLDEAKKLAALRTALAREVGMCQKMPRWALIDSLRFEAEMREASGNADQALPLRREADQLAAIPQERCSPCVMTPRAIPPGARCQ